ncbi:type II toxin-antitoxin system Phd/YefM family antitoxin [Butyrivibrio sp. M55]|uniref:type II toxin-antitoxin system Phd/YefM family antitoxin n=1 Tax=Butyrivibrio sp. M55 TaxID=1855323 RepID=UPI0008F0CA90|nr:type II toxin-antitoxin system Phd/YefM family antitoxin [Butyrivibrio sp. M55]SFU44515.1 Antitoxin Phd_YefM, type II toxin-antitoxin system [Butyrivibrio sp. M55]
MQNMVYALENMIPISLFNRGQAGKIFSEVKKGISKVVIKNNEPEAVLLSPQEYKRLMDMAEDYELIQLTLERLEQEDFSKTISGKEMMSELGITQEEIDAMEDVEFE